MVAIDGCFSAQTDIVSGASQSSMLGPDSSHSSLIIYLIRFGYATIISMRMMCRSIFRFHLKLFIIGLVIILLISSGAHRDPFLPYFCCSYYMI